MPGTVEIFKLSLPFHQLMWLYPFLPLFLGCLFLNDRFRQLRVSFIVAMEMQEDEIAQRVVAVVMVDVLISKEQFTPATFPFLFVKKLRFPRMHQRMCFQALTPVE